MNLKMSLLFVAIIALVFPLLLKPLLDVMDWFALGVLTEKGREVLNYFSIDKSTYLTILSIEATTLVAFSIYWMQKRAEKLKEQEQKEQARDRLFSTLVASLKEVHALSRLDLYEEQDYHFIRISEKHFEAISEIKGLTDEDIRLLNVILKELECLVEHEKEDEVGDIRLHTDKLISYIMIPAYVQYKYDVAEPKDVFEVMNEQLLSILRKFGYAQGSEEKYRFFSIEDDLMIEYDVEGNSIVYNSNGEKICNAYIDNKGIRDGWARLYSEGTVLYEGEWQNYKKHGQGTEYLNDYGDYQYISKEGIWKDGQLWDGKIKDVLVNSEGTLLNEKVIQIHERFYMEEARELKDIKTLGVANIIVKEGELSVDSTETIREVKSTFENKYGAVEWSDLYEYDEGPNIIVRANEKNELELEFNPTLDIERMRLPERIVIDEIPKHLMKYITAKEIEAYNEKLPETHELVKDYNREIEIYEFAQAFGVVLDLSVMNEGNRKANDIHIEISFPNELIVLEGTTENLEEPEMPNLPRNPLDKAWSKFMGTDRLLSAMGPVGIFSHHNSFINNADLLASITPSNPNYSIKLEGNTISISCDELLHTKQKEFNSKYLIVPTEAREFDVNVSVICEEYNERDEFTMQVTVREIDH